MMPSKRLDVAWIAAGLAALSLYWVHGVLRRVGTTVDFSGGDLVYQFLPDYAYLAERMRAGSIAQWNPWQGQPFLATLLPGTFYPARLLLLFLAPQTAMHVSTVLHLGLSWLGTFLLAREVGAGRAAAALGGCLFLGIFALPNVYWSSFLEGGTWLPWAALSLLRLDRTGRARWAVALGACIGLPVLAGGYQHALYAGYGVAIFGLAEMLDTARRGHLASPRGLLLLVLAGAVALATAAPQALPTLAWSRLTIRSVQPLTDDQLDFWAFIEATTRGYRMFSPWAPASQTLVSIPVLALAVVGGLGTGRFGLVLLVATVIVVEMSLGRGGWAFPLFRVLPGFSSFRLPERLSFVFGFLFAVGAALGATRLQRGGAASKTVAGLLSAAALWCLFAPRRLESALPWTLPPSQLHGPPQLMSLVERTSRDHRTLLTGGGPVDGICPKQPGRRHVRSLEDYNPLSSRRLAGYLHGIVGKPPPEPDQPDIFVGFLPMNEPIARPEMLDMASVRTVLLRGNLPMPDRTPPFRMVGRHGSWALWQNPSAFPRAYTIERARFVADDDAALATVRSPAFDPRAEVVLTGDPPEGGARPLLDPPTDPSSLRAARIVRDDPERVGIEVDAERPAVLVLTDPIAPGWTARVDGEPAQVFAANQLGRGVLVPEGRHRVEFEYRAPGLGAGLATFAIGWGLVIAGALAARRSRGPRRAAPGVSSTSP